MRVTRRLVLGGVATAAVLPQQLLLAAAQGTPEAASAGAPGYALARMRALPSAELNAAIFPDVMARFLPATAAVPGYAGYVFSQHASDPTASITLTLLADEADAAAAGEVAQEYVSGLDPRFVVETPIAEQGPIAVFRMTDRPATELPPFLHGCPLTLRLRTTAPGADMDAVTAGVNAELAPTLAAMPGFVLYCVIGTESGRTAINIWETPDQLAAGSEAVRAWVVANAADAFTGDPVINDGVVQYADIIGGI